MKIPHPSRASPIHPALQAYADAGHVGLPTKLAAIVLGLKEQTLRKWACYENAPGGIRPVRIGRRLLWLIADLSSLLQGSER